MFEDSMKNIRGCKALGMGTVLLTGGDSGDGDATAKGESTKMGDTPEMSDPAVDVSMAICSDLKDACPFLWEKQFPSKRSSL
jgi:FMN phosphatase YigB (HAD superfamily)